MKITIISILLAGVLITGAIIYSSTVAKNDGIKTENNVQILNGTQIIEMNVFGGYNPQKSIAKAGIPTMVRFKTNNTFDCSSAIRIPSMNITKVLPQTGQTDISLGSPRVGTLQGFCGMGMYRFNIDFK